MRDVRLVRAERVLASSGLSAAVALAGHADDVLAVRAPIGQLERLRSLAPELKELGFRYVTLELSTEEML